jgi:hypothetical protein
MERQFCPQVTLPGGAGTLMGTPAICSIAATAGGLGVSSFFWKWHSTALLSSRYTGSRKTLHEAEPMSSRDQSTDHSWYVIQRWQQYEGEARANLLRILAIGTFYLIHLWNYFSSQGKLPDWGFLQLAVEGQIERRFHLLVTFLALAWILLAAVVHLSLQDRVFPKWLPLVSTLCDVLFLTCILIVASGPQSPLIVAYFLVIALAALRLDLQLVRITTVAAIAGYLCILGYAKWPATFGGDEKVITTVPRYEQLVVLAALALTGIIIGQVVRRVRNLLREVTGE